MLREIPKRDWNLSKRRTPREASRTTRRLHHSPTTSRHWATEQFMSSKLVRCMLLTIVSSIMKRKREPPAASVRQLQAAGQLEQVEHPLVAGAVVIGVAVVEADLTLGLSPLNVRQQLLPERDLLHRGRVHLVDGRHDVLGERSILGVVAHAGVLARVPQPLVLPGELPRALDVLPADAPSADGKLASRRAHV